MRSICLHPSSNYTCVSAAVLMLNVSRQPELPTNICSHTNLKHFRSDEVFQFRNHSRTKCYKPSVSLSFRRTCIQRKKEPNPLQGRKSRACHAKSPEPKGRQRDARDVARGRDVRLWRPSGVPWAPGLLRGRRATFCSARGVMYVSGVPLASLGLRAFCVAGVRLSALQGARCTSSGVPSGVPWAPPPFAWQARGLSALQGA